MTTTANYPAYPKTFYCSECAYKHGWLESSINLKSLGVCNYCNKTKYCSFSSITDRTEMVEMPAKAPQEPLLLPLSVVNNEPQEMSLKEMGEETDEFAVLLGKMMAKGERLKHIIAQKEFKLKKLKEKSDTIIDKLDSEIDELKDIVAEINRSGSRIDDARSLLKTRHHYRMMVEEDSVTFGEVKLSKEVRDAVVSIISQAILDDVKEVYKITNELVKEENNGNV